MLQAYGLVIWIASVRKETSTGLILWDITRKSTQNNYKKNWSQRQTKANVLKSINTQHLQIVAHTVHKKANCDVNKCLYDNWPINSCSAQLIYDVVAVAVKFSYFLKANHTFYDYSLDIFTEQKQNVCLCTGQESWQLAYSLLNRAI